MEANLIRVKVSVAPVNFGKVSKLSTRWMVGGKVLKNLSYLHIVKDTLYWSNDT